MISQDTNNIEAFNSSRPSAARAVGQILLGLALSVSFALLSQSAHAASQQTEALLRQAEKQYEQLEYEQALKTLIQVQQAPDLTPIQRARTYLYMGVAFTALGRAENAVQAFMEVLKLRPKFRLPPGVSPSIRAMFGQAIKRLNLPQAAAAAGAQAGAAPPTAGPPAAGAAAAGAKPASGVDLSVRAPKKVLAGKPVPIQIEIDDAKRQVRELVIRWRRRKDPDYSTIRITYAPGSTKAKGVIPGAAIGEEKGKLLYYVEARNSSGTALASAGNEEEPRNVTLALKTVKKKDGKSTWHWWALGIGGAAALVTAGVLTAIFVASSGEDLAPLSITIR